MTNRIREAQVYAENIVETVREPFLVLDEDLLVIAASRPFYRNFRLKKENTEGRVIYELGNKQWDIPRLRRLLKTVILERNNIEDFELRHRFESIGEKIMLLNVRFIVQEDGKPGLILLAIEDITDFSVAQKELEEKSFKLDALLDFIPEGIVFTDANHVVEKISRYAGEIFGVPPEKLMHTDEPARLDLLDLYWPNGERMQPDELPLSLAAITGEEYTDFEVILKQGDLHRTLSAAAGPIRDSQGNIIGAVGGWRDITEHKRAEEELQLKTAQLEATIDSIPDGYIIYGRDRSIIRMNPVAEEILGYTDKEQSFPYEKRVSILQLQTPTGEPFPIEHTPSSRAFAGETVRNQIMRMFHPPHQHYWLSVSAAPIITSDGSMLGVVLELRDITKQKNAEEALRQRAEEVERLLEAVPAAVWVAHDPQCLTITGNRRANEFYEARAEDNVSASTLPEARRFFTPDGRELPAEELPLEKAVAINKNVLDTEMHVELPSGRRIVMLGSAVPLRDPKGNVRGGIAAFMDITDRKQTEQALQAMTDNLEQLVLLRTEKIQQQTIRLRDLTIQLGQAEQRERKRLAKIVHDQIQQLIVAARMQIEWLMKKSDRPQEQIQSALERICRVLSEALQESRSLTVQISPPILQKAGLSGCLAWLAAQMREQFHFKVNFHSGLETELRNENTILLLFESVRELLFNAIKHSGEKEADVELLPSDSTTIKIIVRDKGWGFDPAVAQSQQTDTSFGLFSVEERLNYFGGRMAIESSPGQGTTITLTVPLDDTQLLTDQQGPISGIRRIKDVSPNKKFGVCRLIIVDDHEIIREGLVCLFTVEPDFEVIGEAADGPEAIKLSSELKPDIVLMDVNLGDMDGTEATRRIIANDPETKVVGLSMFQDDEVAQAMQEAGAIEFLTKGVPSAHLLSAIRKCHMAG